MNFFSNLKLKHKISLLPTISIIGFLIYLTFNINISIKNEVTLTQIETKNYPILKIVHQNWISILEIQSIFEDAIAEQDEDILSEAIVNSKNILSQFEEIKKIDNALASEVTIIQSLFNQYFSTASELATRISNGEEIQSIGIEKIQLMHLQFSSFKKNQQEFKYKIEKSFTKKLKESVDNSAHTNHLGIIISIILIVILVILSILITLRITKPINYANKIATDIMHNNWNSNDNYTPPKNNDEVGKLIQAFVLMKTKLKVTITDLEVARDIAISEGKANKEKSLFISHISHELRTPIHAILSYGKLGFSKKDKADTEKLGSYFEKITTSAYRLSNLIDNIIALVNIQSNHSELETEENDLDTLIKTTLAANKFENKFKYTPMSTKALVSANTKQISQVINSLLSNAAKYSAPQSTIEISIENNSTKAREDNKQICIAIKDEGVGIPDDELTSVFEVFTQSSRTRTGAGGTGMGLALSKAIIKLYKGDIWIENNEAEGITVFFCLPIIPSK